MPWPRRGINQRGEKRWKTIVVEMAKGYGVIAGKPHHVVGLFFIHQNGVENLVKLTAP